MKISEVLAKIEENKSNLEFMKSGFSKIDHLLDGGFLRKELVVVGGFTGVGKSYFSSQIMYNIAKQGFNTAFFSLEISNETVVSRLLGNLSNINPTQIRSGYTSTEEHEDLVKAKTSLEGMEELMEFYDDKYALKEIFQSMKGAGLDFIVVDFIQNIFTSADDEYSRLSEVALNLQKLAKKGNCCIMVMSQLSNQAGRSGIDNKIVEYKGSGNIATVADLGFLLEKPDSNTLRVALQKNRRGISRQFVDLTIKYPGGLLYEKIQ